MKFKLHYDVFGGTWGDEVIIFAGTVEEMKRIADKEVEKQGWNKKFCWCELIEDDNNKEDSNGKD